MERRAVASSFLGSWAVQDVEMTAMHMHPDVVYKIHVGTNLRPFGGERRGVEECREAMFAILADFDYLEYVPTIVNAIGNVVRAQIKFKCRHRRTGTEIEGTRRIVICVRNGLIERVDSYHDAQLIEAYLRLTHQREIANEVVSFQFPRRETEGSGTGTE